MRLPVAFVLPLLVGAAIAALETAKVYIFQEPEYPLSLTIPTLTPEEARLVVAQRLGVSRYHSLRGVSNDALAHINAFGGPHPRLFANDGQHVRSQLVVLIDNVTPELSLRYEKEWAPTQHAFKVSNPPSRRANLQLVQDLHEQNPLLAVHPSCTLQENANPFNEECWPGRFKILHFEAKPSETTISAFSEIMATMLTYVKSEAMDVMVILMPKSSRNSLQQYGTYDMPARPLKARSTQFEEPIEQSEALPLHGSNNFSPAKEKKKPVAFSTCYETNKTCQSSTNNCSGHGHCIAKYVNDTEGESCYTCGCIPSIIDFMRDGKNVTQITYWGGVACQKEDISSPFWLLAGISIVLVSIVSAGIGMLFSVGEEKLPSVIGAGVSGSKAR